MNRVKAGDAWARVSTKRYGSRLDGNEARIEILSVSPSLFLSSSRLLFVFLPPPPPSLSPLLSLLFVHIVSLSLARPLFTPLCGPMNPRGIIVTSFVPFDYLGTIQLCAKTS